MQAPVRPAEVTGKRKEKRRRVLASVLGVTITLIMVAGVLTALLTWLRDAAGRSLEQLLSKVTVTDHRQLSQHHRLEHNRPYLDGYYLGPVTTGDPARLVSVPNLFSPPSLPSMARDEPKPDADGTTTSTVGRSGGCPIWARRYPSTREFEPEAGLSGSDLELVRAGKLEVIKVTVLCDTEPGG